MDICDMSIVFHSAFLFLVGEFALFHDGVSFDFFEAFSDKSCYGLCGIYHVIVSDLFGIGFYGGRYFCGNCRYEFDGNRFLYRPSVFEIGV